MNVAFQPHQDSFAEGRSPAEGEALKLACVTRDFDPSSGLFSEGEDGVLDLGECMIALNTCDEPSQIKLFDLTVFLCVKIPLHGRIDVERGGTNLAIEYGKAVLIGSSQDLVARGTHGSRFLTIWLKRDLMATRLSCIGGNLEMPSLKAVQSFDLSEPRVAFWLRTVQTAWSQRRELEALDDLYGPKIKDSHSSLIVDTFLHLQSRSLWSRNSGDTRSVPRPLQRAVAFIELNIAEQISISAVALEAQMSVRSLQLKFKQYFGQTPLAYIKAKRLRTAHRLLREGASNVSVTEIALSCGIEHLGRFSRDYQEAFGCKPSDTLKKRT